MKKLESRPKDPGETPRDRGHGQQEKQGHHASLGREWRVLECRAPLLLWRREEGTGASHN